MGRMFAFLDSHSLYFVLLLRYNFKGQESLKGNGGSIKICEPVGSLQGHMTQLFQLDLACGPEVEYHCFRTMHIMFFPPVPKVMGMLKFCLNVSLMRCIWIK